MSSSSEDTSPKIVQSFQVDKFVKKSNYLNIPDTIPEQSSGELSTNTVKMEVFGVKSYIKDDTYKNNKNHSLSSDDFSDASTVTPTVNSFLKDCEKNLCDFSSSDENSFLSARSKIEMKDFKKLYKELGFLNDTLSTPPNELRQQIKNLRDDMAEIHEFHDLEIQCMKDEKMIDDESDSYLQLFTKYTELLELYTSLKKEYDELKNNHDKITDELHYTTTNCLEKLCSQIEASDNSLNLSNNSFASFNTEIKSSTMLGFKSEVETSIVNNHTLLAQDPLALSIDTPIKSSKKLFLFPLNSSDVKKKIINLENIRNKKDNLFDLSSDYTNKVLNIETVLQDKIIEMDNLENRLLKVEDVSNILQDESNKVISVLQNENILLKKKLSEKTEELDKLTEKLLTEIIALNPTLSKSLTELSTCKLLTVFIETIMEICNNIQNQLIKKFDNEKLNWEESRKADSDLIENLKNQIKTLTVEVNSFEEKIRNFEDLNKRYDELNDQLIEANKIISTRNDEIDFLQSHTNNKQIKRDLAVAEESISTLQFQLGETEKDKIILENQCKKLEDETFNLKKEIELKEIILQELKQSTTNLEFGKKESEILKKTIYQMEEITNNSRNDEIYNIEQVKNLTEKIISLTNQKVKLENLFDYFLANKMIYFDAFSSIYSNFNCDDETIIQLLNEKFESLLNYSFEDLKDKKWLSVLSEGIIACSKYVKQELNKESLIVSDKWNLKIDDQTKIIEDLKNQIKDFLDNSERNLNTISELKSEKEIAEKLCDTLKQQLIQAEKNIIIRDDEIIILKSCEEDFKKTKEDYSSSIETLLKLKTELLSVEKEKLEMENKYHELREANENLQILINTKDLILKDFDNFKVTNEKLHDDYEALKRQLKESELLILSLEDQLKIAENKSSKKDDELNKLINDIKDKEKDLLLIENLNNQIKNLNNKINDYEFEVNKLRDVKNQYDLAVSEKEEKKNIITTLIAENNCLKSQCIDFNITDQDFSLTKKTIEKLQSELVTANAEQNKFETINKKQDILIANLQSEMEAKTTFVEKLQNQIKFLCRDCKHYTTKINELSQEKQIWENLCDNYKELAFECEKIISKEKKEILEKENLEKLCETLRGQLSETEKKIELTKNESETKFRNTLLEKENLEKLCETLRGQLSETEKKIELTKNESETKFRDTLLEKENLEKLCETLRGQLSETEKKIELTKNESETKFRDTLLEKENLEKLCETLRVQLSETEKKTELTKNESETKFRDTLLEKENLEKLCETLRGQLSETEKKIELTKNESETKFRDTLLEKENLEKLCETLRGQLSETKKYILETNEVHECSVNKLILEKEEFSKMCENYKEELSEAFKKICAQDSEIVILKTYEADLKKAKQDLFTIDETLQKLKTEIIFLESKKLDLENKCFELEKANINLENSNKVKDKILKDLENYKANGEIIRNDYEGKIEELENLRKQHNDLREELVKAENIISLHKKEIYYIQLANKKSEENLTSAIQTIEKLQIQILDVENEKTNLKDTCKKLEEKTSNLKSEVDTKNLRLKEVEKTVTSYESNKIENDSLKEKILDMEKIAKNLKDELDIAKKEINNIEKLKEVNAQILALDKKHNQLFDSILNGKDLFTKAFSSIYSTSSVMNDAVVKILNDKLKSTLNYSFNEEDEKWLSTISEAIIACCNFVKQELNKESKFKEEEWIMKLAGKATLIESLEIQIDSLCKTTEKNDLKILEMKLERDKFEKLCENMKIQLKEDEKIIKTLENEMINLNSCKEDLKKAKLDLEVANEKIFNQKSKLSSLESEKLEIENRCIQLEEGSNTKSTTKDMTLRSGRSVDLCSRRLDKLEEINHNLMELISSILITINFPNVDKLKLMSIRDYPCIIKKINSHLQEMESKTKNLEATNAELDEECDSYAKTIKELKKEAAAVWKINKKKTELLESEIKKLKEEQTISQKEKEDLLKKISKLDNEYQKLKVASSSKETSNSCNCGVELKKIHELKRTILIKEQKILELNDLENQNSLYKSQIKYLENALEQEKKKVKEEAKKNKKLLNDINELGKTHKDEKENLNNNEMLEELKLRGSITGGVVREFMDKEKMRKLSKDIEILKEVCRARYTEIKRLEAENASLKSTIPKNSNQMDSPIRTRSQRKGKPLIKEMWKPEVDGKENFLLQ